jgi:hypothetical protein
VEKEKNIEFSRKEEKEDERGERRVDREKLCDEVT